MGILSSASNTGYVLPGYARTEEFMSHFLTDLTGKLHIFVGSVLRPCFSKKMSNTDSTKNWG
jgi:hypothetical protein